MILNTILVLVIAIFSYLVLPIFLLLIKNKKARNICIISFFLVYLIILIIGVFSKFSVDKNNISIVFENTGIWCGKHIYLDFYRVSKWDFLINLFMLLPVGMFVGYFSKNLKFCKIFLRLCVIGVSTGLMIETLQFILPVPRMVQLSDVILNTISVILGGLQLLLYKKLFVKNPD